MGRRTWESIGRALPGRRTVVVTRQTGYQTANAEVDIATSLQDALQTAERAEDDEAFIVGGAELYREALSRANRLYLTRLHAAIDGDTSFPYVDWNNWTLFESEEHDANEKNQYGYRFETYNRR
jgi:dihydrofolate reductase